MRLGQYLSEDGVTSIERVDVIAVGG